MDTYSTYKYRPIITIVHKIIYLLLVWNQAISNMGWGRKVSLHLVSHLLQFLFQKLRLVNSVYDSVHSNHSKACYRWDPGGIRSHLDLVAKWYYTKALTMCLFITAAVSPQSKHENMFQLSEPSQIIQTQATIPSPSHPDCCFTILI